MNSDETLLKDVHIVNNFIKISHLPKPNYLIPLKLNQVKLSSKTKEAFIILVLLQLVQPTCQHSMLSLASGTCDSALHPRDHASCYKDEFRAQPHDAY